MLLEETIVHNALPPVWVSRCRFVLLTDEELRGYREVVVLKSTKLDVGLRCLMKTVGSLGLCESGSSVRGVGMVV
jgi:hypothetical protein